MTATVVLFFFFGDFDLDLDLDRCFLTDLVLTDLAGCSVWWEELPVGVVMCSSMCCPAVGTMSIARADT